MDLNQPNALEQPELAGEESPETGETTAPVDSDDPLEGRDDLQKVLFSLYLECCGEDRYPRLLEVKDVKQAELYWAGHQYNWWSDTDKQWCGPSQAPMGELSIEDMPRFEFVTNIYQARGLMTIGAGTGAPPRYRFFPDDADNENDLETAAGRTKLAKLIQRWNPVQKLLQEEYYHAWTGGFIAWWSRYVPNGEKYGVDSVNLLSQGSQELESTITCPSCGWSAPAEQAMPPVPCPQCMTQLTDENISEEEPIQVPEDGGTQEIPKGRQVITVYGTLNCKRPQHTNQQSQWHYFAIEDEIHYSILRGAHEDKADQIKPGMNFGADDVFERNARLVVAENAKRATQTGSNQESLVTWAAIWFRPTAFWMVKDKKHRKELLELFPRGVHCQFGGSTYLTSKAESLDDAVVSTHAMPGRGQHRPAIGTAMLSVQDRFNTFTNIAAETYEYGIPITYRAADTFSGEANDDQRAAPGLEVEVALQPGQDLRSKIMQVRADSVSPDMAKHAMDLMGPVADELTGTYPALTGAADNQPETLGQQSMQRDAAMGRQGIFYVNLKQAHADLMTISCRSLEANMDGEVKIPVLGQSGDFESESVDVTALEGEAEAYPEGDENFPELWNQQRATMMQVADTPYGAELMKDMSNAELFAKLLGIADLKIPNIDSWRKQLKEIGELTKMPEDDGMLSAIAPMVEVDPDTDNHPVEAQCCLWWLNSEQGQKMKRDNPLGWMAVKEHGAKHKMLILPPEPEQKPLNQGVTTAFKDMPPEAQAQYLEKEFGIKVSPQDFLAAVALEHAKKTPKVVPGGPQPGGPKPGVAAPPQ